MPQAIGKTYGYGRVSPKSRPSPYTPVHLPSVAPGVTPAGDASSQPARARRRRLAGMLAIAVVVAASALAAAGMLRASSRVTAEVAPARGSTLLAQDDDAGRLARSPFAASPRSAQP
jgi:hypothetical protein